MRRRGLSISAGLLFLTCCAAFFGYRYYTHQKQNFTGTLAEFEPRITELIDERARDNGIDPAMYDEEKKYIINLVQLCTTISANDIQAAKSQRVDIIWYDHGKYRRCLGNGRVPAQPKQYPLYIIHALIVDSADESRPVSIDITVNWASLYSNEIVDANVLNSP